MKKNSTDSRKARAMLTVSRVLVYALLIFLSILCLFSFYMLIINASRTNADLQGGFKALPQGHFLENLINAWNDSSINIPRGMLNSFVIAAATAILSTYFSALTAYGLHAYQFKLKRIAFLFIMAVMVIPKQVSAAGFVQLCYKLKLTNSYLPLILPGIAAPVVFFYMIQYMKSVLPMEIVEAARVDGSGEFFTFNRIVLPMLKPAISVQLIFTFVESWNNYFLPALLLDKAEMKTVPIMIAQLRAADYSKFDLGKVYMFILLAICRCCSCTSSCPAISSRESPPALSRAEALIAAKKRARPQDIPAGGHVTDCFFGGTEKPPRAAKKHPICRTASSAG